jgi:hypothetical protein
MIKAHEHMLQNELKEAVAESDQKKDIPSPEEFALQDLVPGQQAVAQSHPTVGGFDPTDPLGLSNLPEATSSLGDIASPAPAPSPAVVSAPSALPTVDTQPNAAPSPAVSAPAAPANDGVLLNPADIYGN